MSELPLPERARLFRERLQRTRLERTRPTDEEITPNSGWTVEPNLHSLLVELPGFKEADIKLRIEKPGSIAISGERITAQNKRVHFEKSFNVPEDSDMESITMKFQGDVLKVSIPRAVKEKKGEPEIKTDEALVSDSKEEIQEEKKGEPEIKTDEALVSDSKEEIQEEKKAEPEIKTDEALVSDSKEEKKEEKKGEPEKTDEAPVSDSKEEIKEEKKGEPEIKTDGALVKDSKEEKKEDPEMPKEEKAQETSEDDKEEARSHAQDETHHDQREATSQRSVIGKISENKGILLASILSFTLGFLLSKKFQPPPPK